MVCQPNSGGCPPVLPYPMSMDGGYDPNDTQRVSVAHAHYITEGVAANDLPFPADKVRKWDKRYEVLAIGGRSESPSLLVCPFGKGRVVVQMGNESRESSDPFSDEVFRRMVIWAASREPVRFRKLDMTKTAAAQPPSAGDDLKAAPEK